jgi:hypothetical protein
VIERRRRELSARKVDRRRRDDVQGHRKTLSTRPGIVLYG